MFLIQPHTYTLPRPLHINGDTYNIDHLFKLRMMASHSRKNSQGCNDNMDNLMLKKLRPGIRDATVCCRVSRIWDCINPTSNNQLISVDVLFIDEEGTSIQATVRQRDAQWLRETVEEGGVYICKGFIVVAATNKYRVCMNPDIISLSRRTTSFKHCYSEELLIFPLHAFSFVEYSDLFKRSTDNTYLTDVIGNLTSISPIDQVYVRNQPVEKRTIQLENLSGETISATLWTTVAHYHVQALMKNGSIVMILAAFAVASFNGQLSLTSKSATRVYIDLSDEATTAFKQALTDPRPTTFTTLGLTLEEQINNNRRTVEELLHLTPSKAKGIRFTCATKIKDINPFDGWWFPACPTCKKRINTSADIYWCENCNAYVDDAPEHWYKLELVIQDNTGDCVFMMIGKTAELLVGQTARDLALKNSDPLILPDAIKKLRGISKIFEVEQMYSRRSMLTYKVIRTFDAMAEQQVSTVTKQRGITFPDNDIPKRPKLQSTSAGATSAGGSQGLID